jgi:hypothetical protein
MSSKTPLACSLSFCQICISSSTSKSGPLPVSSPRTYDETAHNPIHLQSRELSSRFHRTPPHRQEHYPPQRGIRCCAQDHLAHDSAPHKILSGRSAKSLQHLCSSRLPADSLRVSQFAPYESREADAERHQFGLSTAFVLKMVTKY